MKMERHRIFHKSLALSKTTDSVKCRKVHSLLPVLGRFIISGFPVLHGCESTQIPDSSFTVTGNSVPVKVAVHHSDTEKIMALDLLTFNDDGLQRLDSYQRAIAADDGTLDVTSREGRKIIMACANTRHSQEDWMTVRSIAGLGRFKADMEDETWDFPSMSGSAYVNAANGDSTRHELKMSGISGEVTLHSISCNFKGRPYEGEKLKNVMVYLTNVNATCPIWGECTYPERIINHGRYCSEDMKMMKDSSLLSAKIEGDIGKDVYRADLDFRCFPNMSYAEGPGSVFTRLVIQGDLEGQTWYWPIDINRNAGNSHEGIDRNTKYIYDITLTRKGSADPDTAISTECITINMNVTEWTEKEDCMVRF